MRAYSYLAIGFEWAWVDLFAYVASLVDTFACLTLLFLPPTPATVDRLCVVLIDPIACIIGYWGLYRRLNDIRPIRAEVGFYL